MLPTETTDRGWAFNHVVRAMAAKEERMATRIATRKTRGGWASLLAALLVMALAACGQQATASPPVSSGGPLVLSPAAGPPGTVVTLHGYLASMRNATTAQRHEAAFGGDIAFGGFAAGLHISADAITWSSTQPGHFITTIRVPVTNWLTPNGTAVLAPGSYQISLRCFGLSVRGCAGGPDQLSATFTLTGSVPKAPVSAYLSFSPPAAAVGALVRVTGWAPLTNVIGQPFGYNLVWGPDGTTAASIRQSLTGRLSGTFRVPAYVGTGPTRAGNVTLSLSYMFLRGKTGDYKISAGKKKFDGLVKLAPTRFRVVEGIRWSALDAVPVRQSAAPSGIWVSPDGSQVLVAGLSGSFLAGTPGALHSVSLNGVAALAASQGYPMLAPGVVGSVRGVAAFPLSRFITVSTYAAQYGSAPPAFASPFVSTDGGATWRTLPVPSGMTYGDFVGFRTAGSVVFALWSKGRTTIAEETANGGQTWSAGSPPCPATGACLMLGPGPGAYEGMGTPEVQLVWRQNRHHQWVTAASEDVNIATLQLSALLHGDALLVDSGAPYPVQLSSDGGRTWQNVAVPNPPGTASGAGSPYTNLLLLPNGELLGSVPGSTGATAWYVLPAGQSRWQSVPSAILPPTAVDLTIADGQLWWYSLPADGQTVAHLHETAPGSL
jgi:hypothetical protein